MEASVNYFSELYKVDVSKHIEKKGKFSYVSWPFAVAELKKRHPEATWEVCRFDGAPFMATNAGVFVEVAVTVNGCTLSQIHPVLNAQNRPIAQPNAFDINTSIQRALVKAIALHGLGLFVYAGEDLPEGEQVQEEAPQKQTLTNARFATAVERIKDGKYTTDKLRETFALTEEQEAALLGALAND